MSIQTIKPSVLFALDKTEGYSRLTTIRMPQRRGPEDNASVTLLDTMCLIACERIVEASRVFEFGTFLGATTVNLELNLNTYFTASKIYPNMVYTLDLPPDLTEVEQPSPGDKETTKARNLYSFREWDNFPEQQIVALLGNSKTFDYTPYHDSIDLIFIDGAHDYATVWSDTENALNMLDHAKLSCIVWHDYKTPQVEGVRQYLDTNFSTNRNCYYINDSNLVVWFNGEVGF